MKQVYGVRVTREITSLVLVEVDADFRERMNGTARDRAAEIVAGMTGDEIEAASLNKSTRHDRVLVKVQVEQSERLDEFAGLCVEMADGTWEPS